MRGAERGRRRFRTAAAIPDTALFAVMLQPENVQIATLDEHFAVDSSPGDVVLLGNTSWRIQNVESVGRVLVEDAHGAPPSIPFWEGEAPQRTLCVERACCAICARRSMSATRDVRARLCHADESRGGGAVRRG